MTIGSASYGAQDLALIPRLEGDKGVESLQGSLGRWLGIALALAATALAAWAIISVEVRDKTGLSAALRPYSDSYRASDDGDEEGDESDGALAQTAILQRAVRLTEHFAERQGLLTRVESLLERANLPLRAAEALFFVAAGSVVLSLLTLVITKSLIWFALVLVLTAVGPVLAVSFMAGQRRRQFEQQLPDMLQLLSGTLRAGYSMMQGVEAVSQEVAEPMGRELRRVVTESRLGRPLEEALDGVGERMNSNDFKWAVMAIRIQREVGGNLSELLLTVAETMIQRERLRRDVRALTAEGRISAYVLGLLPPGVMVMILMSNPDYLDPLFDETFGVALLVTAGVLMIAGFIWMSKIVKIDI
jgi:tight adherence protein B